MLRRSKLDALVIFLVLALCGCNGNLVIHEISPKRIVLVDMLPRESFQATQRCLTLDVFHVDPLGTDWGISERVTRTIAQALEKEGYGVDVISAPEQFERKTFPAKYMLTPWEPYNTEWDSRFVGWLRDTGAGHNAGAVVFLTTYSVSLYNQYGPFYSGYGVRGSLRCIGIPPTRVGFYANTGVNVFTVADGRRKYFSKGHGNKCDIDAPAAIENAMMDKVLKAADVEPYAGLIQKVAEVEIQQALIDANVLHGQTDSCPAEIK